MERRNNVKGRVGSKAVAQIMWPSILLAVLLLALLDTASSTRSLQNPKGFPSLYHLGGSVMDAAVKIFDAESNRGVVPVLQSFRPHHERFAKRVLIRKCQEPSPSSCGDDCVGNPNPESPPPNCGVN